MTAIFPVVNRVITRTFAAGLLCACLVALNGCDSKDAGKDAGGAAPGAAKAPDKPAAPAVGKVGQKIEKAGVAMTLAKTEKKDSLSDFEKAGEGKVYQLAEVVIEATGDEKASYNLMYFKVKDDTGVEYSSDIITISNALKSGDLTKGEKTRGVVAFKVPKDAKGLVMTYEPISFGSDDRKIKFAL